jgi:subtilisin family serine protease
MLVACGGSVDGDALAETGQELGAVPGSYLVDVTSGGDAAVDSWIRARGVASRRFQKIRGRAVDGLTRADAAELAQLPGVAGVYPNRVIGIGPDGKPGGGGGGGTAAQVVPENVRHIAADQAWATSTGAGIGIAIVDTGLDFAHTDLRASPTCFSAVGAATACGDANGHGTHVAGIAAAINNETDVVGVAPDATVYAVRVLDAAGSGSDAQVMAGLDWVASNWNSVSPPIRVANLSLGRDGAVDDNPVLHAAVQAVTAAGVTVVVAAGNDQSKDVSTQIPAAYPEVLAIASTTARTGGLPSTGACKTAPPIAADTASYFTTDGTGVFLSAPGEEAENISKSCFIQSFGVLSLALGGGTTRMSGTSMAAPMVSGVVALAAQAGLALAQSDATSVGVAPLNSPASGYTFDGVREGVVNALAAVAP